MVLHSTCFVHLYGRRSVMLGNRSGFTLDIAFYAIEYPVISVMLSVQKTMWFFSKKNQGDTWLSRGPMLARETELYSEMLALSKQLTRRFLSKPRFLVKFPALMIFTQFFTNFMRHFKVKMWIWLMEKRSLSHFRKNSNSEEDEW